MSRTKKEGAGETSPRYAAQGKARKKKAEALGRVPRLRFPEYLKEKAWDLGILGHKAIVNPARTELDDETLVSFVPMSSVSEEGHLIDTQTKMFSELKKGYPFFVNKDIIIAKITPCYENGKSAIVNSLKNGAGFGSTEFHVIRAKAALDPDFLFGYLNLESVRQLGLMHMMGSGGQQRVPSSFYENLLLFIPSVKEQKKIAACLSSLDSLIVAHSQKLEALKSYKRGLMQQLFPAEGETVPRLRFPEFRDAGEWKIAHINDIADVYSGGTPDRTNKEYWNGEIPWVTTSLINNARITSADEHITGLGLRESSAKIFPCGTVLMAMYGQGVTRGKVAMLGIPAATNQACAAIIPSIDISPTYIFYYLSAYYEKIRALSNSGGQANLSIGLIKEIHFAYPGNTLEQHKIVVLLSSFDDVIFAQVAQIESLRAHKRGLMQGLFPASEEEGR